MSSIRKMKDFHYSFHIALTSNTAKLTTLTQKLKNFILCYSTCCLSLCLDKPFQLIKRNYLAFVCGVVAACYQQHKQNATTPHGKILCL